jgi:hypothetical protein
MAILGPNKDVLGNFYGQEVRKEWSKGDQGAGSIIVVTEPDASVINYLADCRLYVISGLDEDAFKKWESIFTPKYESKLLLINCQVEPDDWIKMFGQVIYCRGEFYGDAFYNEWKDFSASHPGALLQDVPQSEAYIADWWPLVTKAAAK